MPKPDKDLEDHQLPVDEIVTFVDPEGDPQPFLDRMAELIEEHTGEED